MLGLVSQTLLLQFMGIMKGKSATKRIQLQKHINSIRHTAIDLSFAPFVLFKPRNSHIYRKLFKGVYLNEQWCVEEEVEQEKSMCSLINVTFTKILNSDG